MSRQARRVGHCRTVSARLRPGPWAAKAIPALRCRSASAFQHKRQSTHVLGFAEVSDVCAGHGIHRTPSASNARAVGKAIDNDGRCIPARKRLRPLARPLARREHTDSAPRAHVWVRRVSPRSARHIEPSVRVCPDGATPLAPPLRCSACEDRRRVRRACIARHMQAKGKPLDSLRSSGRN